MEQMTEFPDKFLPQAYRALAFIGYQLNEVAQYCNTMLHSGLVSPSTFLDLEKYLQRILHETGTTCRPPPKKPVKSDFLVMKLVASCNFGTVNHVRHKQTCQSFAMKEIKRIEKKRNKVLMERDILTFLDHPLVISMFCSFETNSHQYMVMEYAGGDIHWPKKRDVLPDEAQNLISLLLDTDPVMRLGVRGASEVKQHPFFKDVDWNLLLLQTPPDVLEVKDEDETSCSQMSPPLVLDALVDQKGFVEDQSGSPADSLDFCYVAFRFNKVYGSPGPLSPVPMNRVEESGEDNAAMVTVPPQKNTNKPQLRMNPVRKFFHQLLRIKHPVYMCNIYICLCVYMYKCLLAAL